MVPWRITPHLVRQQPEPGVTLIQFGGILQHTVARHGTRARSTAATLLGKFNTGGTRPLQLLPLEDGKQSMVTFNLFALGIANIFASILMEVIFNPREAG